MPGITECGSRHNLLYDTHLKMPSPPRGRWREAPDEVFVPYTNCCRHNIHTGTRNGIFWQGLSRLKQSRHCKACKAAIRWIAGRLCRLPTAKSKILARHQARPARAGNRRFPAALPAPHFVWAPVRIRETQFIKASWFYKLHFDIADFAPRPTLRLRAGFGPAQPMSRGLSPHAGRALMNPLPVHRRTASIVVSKQKSS